MDARSAVAGVVVGVLLGVLAAGLFLSNAQGPHGARSEYEAGDLIAVPPDARGPLLGDDAQAIGSIRLTAETSCANGAGTTNPIVIWFDNRGSRLSDDPLVDFEAGRIATAALTTRIPRTVGELRASSIVLTMALERAAISAS